MEIIRVKVDRQQIQVEQPQHLVAGTINYLQMVFTFGTDWNGYKKVAVFDTDYPVPIINGSCMVPNEIAKKKAFSVRVVGQRGNMRTRTDFAVIKQR